MSSSELLFITDVQAQTQQSKIMTTLYVNLGNLLEFEKKITEIIIYKNLKIFD